MFRNYQTMKFIIFIYHFTVQIYTFYLKLPNYLETFFLKKAR